MFSTVRVENVLLRTPYRLLLFDGESRGSKIATRRVGIWDLLRTWKRMAGRGRAAGTILAKLSAICVVTSPVVIAWSIISLISLHRYRFPIYPLPLISISHPHPQIPYTMSPSPTENAPTNLEELKELLKNDNKVKVAGTYLYLCHHWQFLYSSVRCRRGRWRCTQGQDHEQGKAAFISQVWRLQFL